MKSYTPWYWFRPWTQMSGSGSHVDSWFVRHTGDKTVLPYVAQPYTFTRDLTQQAWHRLKRNDKKELNALNLSLGGSRFAFPLLVLEVFTILLKVLQGCSKGVSKVFLLLQEFLFSLGLNSSLQPKSWPFNTTPTHHHPPHLTFSSSRRLRFGL